MQRDRCMKSTGLLLCSALIVQYSIAADDAELTQREQVASRTLSAATAVEREWGRLQVARDQYFYSETGAKTQLATWLEDTYHWVDQWDKQLIALEVSNPNAVNTVLSNLEDLINQQHAQLAVLDDHFQKLRIRIDEGQAFIGKKQALNPNSLPDYRQVIQAVEQSQKQLVKAFNSLKQDSNEQLQKIRTISQVSTKAIRAKLKLQLMQAGVSHLNEVLALYDQLVTYEREVLTELAKLTDTEMKMSEYALNFQYFSAKSHYKSSQDTCKLAIKSINSAAISDQKKQHALKQANATCKALDTHWSSLKDIGLTPAQMVDEYRQMMVAVWEKECRKKVSQINCEKFAVLRSVPLKTLSTMPEKDLAFYEMAWSTITHNQADEGAQ